ncbi:helix-turn-helix domain-containing protein [Marinactinospora rubrisoli]|uniref:Helix-turn-helix domain-containing protein n=1 Tax=Marinactinospora rubrisoli TaxID=2715399 RepID=A0ABW2KNP0_9ACTN
MAALDLDALYVALDRRRRAHRMSWRAVAAQAGVSPSLLTRIGRGGPAPSADNLVRLLGWLDNGFDLAPYVDAPVRAAADYADERRAAGEA